jgi:dienelactone hydrolase
VRVWVCVLAVLAVAGCGGKSHGSRASLSVTPARELADTTVTVRASGLAPHATVTLRASWAGFRGQRAASSIPLRADGEGRIDLRGFDGDRFLWGMQTTPADRIFALPDTGDTVVRLALAEGGKVVARGALHRRVGGPGLDERVLTFDRDRLVGVFIAPTTGRRRGAVLAVGGSGGGVEMIDVAALLASHGHPTLALGYFGVPGLPSQLRRIPLEYFARGLRWLARQPSVDPGHMTMLGTSRGAEPALLSGIDFPKLVHAVIALVPEPEVALALDNRTPAWTYRGKPLGQQPIAVERVRGPILMASAGDDAMAPSSFATRGFEARLTAHRFRYFHERLDYPSAGHDIASLIPYLPEPAPGQYGGTPRASALAKTELWPRILDFLDDHAQ